MSWWLWSSRVRTLLRVSMWTARRRTLAQETRWRFANSSDFPFLHVDFFRIWKPLNQNGSSNLSAFNLCAFKGLMFGYATDETEECMPLTIVLAHKLNSKMAELRRNGIIPWLRPDSKTQVFLNFYLFYFYSPNLINLILVTLSLSSRREHHKKIPYNSS